MLRSILAQGAEGDENSAAELSVPTTTTNVADQQHSEPAGDEEYYAISSRSAALFTKIQSLCGHKHMETALRALISNAFHALDYAFFSGQKSGLAVRIGAGAAHDKSIIRLSVSDSGVGMTRSDIINNLSSLGRLDREEIHAQLDAALALATADGDDTAVMESSSANNVNEDNERGSRALNLMQLGFFAAFLVAERVLVVTKHDDDEQYLFELGFGDSHFVIRKGGMAPERVSEILSAAPPVTGSTPVSTEAMDPRSQQRGTTLHLVLKADCAAVLEEASLRSLVGGWENAGISVSSIYPVLFWPDAGDTGASENEVERERRTAEDELQDLQLDDLDKEPNEKSSAAASRAHYGSGEGSGAYSSALPQASMLERAKYIPLRLSYDDRKVLRLAEGGLSVSSYTDNVDAVTLTDPKKTARRRQKQIEEICALLSGIVVACDYNNGQELLEDRNFSRYKTFFRTVFEIVRRYKIMNPEKMRTSYGKLLYLLQDAASDDVKELLGFNIVAPIRTVYSLLEKSSKKNRGLELLKDSPLIEYATMEILPDPTKSRPQIQALIRRKEKAIAALVKKHASSSLSPDDIRLCCYSICDNNSYLNSDRRPCDQALSLLEQYFSPSSVSEGYSLSIVAGDASGSRLTHSHEKQWNFARQSLLLWREIINDMFRLWSLAEQDLLSADAPYTLKNTGQGAQRVQPSPRTYKAMQQILRSVQQQVDNWVGSSMIHMGDHNVPNALHFVDKYNQVARILSPLINVLENLEQLCQDDDGIRKMIESGYGGMKKLRLDILHDFFRSAFDGSGADNFYDAGSCIDGRLTSAWNWCSTVESKPYFPLFKLVGFNGFDGEFGA